MLRNTTHGKGAPTAPPAAQQPAPFASGGSPPASRTDVAVALFTMLLVFVGVAYVLPITPFLLLWRAWYSHRSVSALLLAAWLAEVAAPVRVRTWPRGVNALRYALFESWRRYFDYHFVAEAQLDPKGVYLFGASPGTRGGDHVADAAVLCARVAPARPVPVRPGERAESD